MSWGDSTSYSHGRTSGSLAWRVSRGEAGVGADSEERVSGGKDDEGEWDSLFYHVESFHPSPHSTACRITVAAPPVKAAPSYSHCIRVSGVSCGPGLATATGVSVSVVVVDEICFCVLQCRSFRGWNGAGRFLDGVPNGRIVAICAGGGIEEEGKGVEKALERVGGLDLSVFGSDEEKACGGEEREPRYLLCVGRLDHVPKWAKTLYQPSGGTSLAVTVSHPSPRPSRRPDEPSPSTLVLRREDRTVPQTVAMRLPDTAMPLKTQQTASEEDKKEAFLRFLDEEGGRERGYVGYCTKKGVPVYLMKKTAFPLRKSGGGGGVGWKTYHFLPEAMVPIGDSSTESDYDTPTSPLFDIPIDEPFFQTLLGPQLLHNSTANPGQQLQTPTTSTLSKSRLVALYFSAHWCPPCRKFTPMLIEVYEHLKEVVPDHGLEIVFVSSDRDEGGFRQYFGGMPWMAMPLDKERKQRLGERFGIQGIPALIVLDTMSGEIVVSKEDSRNEIATACRGGTVSIERMLVNEWMKRIPPESQMIMETLALSCKEENRQKPLNVEVDPYLKRASTTTNTTETKSYDPSIRIKEIFDELVVTGLDPNVAAAQAIGQVGKEQAAYTTSTAALTPGALAGTAEILLVTAVDKEENGLQPTAERIVAETAKRYLDNVLKNPHSPRFRSFRTSNAVFDRISSSTDGVEAVVGLGFAAYGGDADWTACIPLAADLEDMHERIERVLKNGVNGGGGGGM